MSRIVLGVAVALLLGACDRPDQVFVPRPKGYDPLTGNGLGPIATHFTGKKDFQDETLAVIPTVPTSEVCTTTEISERWTAMVKQPIVPMKGAGGLDMTGGKEWKGLTIDEAQSRDLLCQAGYYEDGVAAWGDNDELIAFFNPATRLIDDILVTPGYLGTIKAGNFEFEINEPITKDGVSLNQHDGSTLDPRTEANLRSMDRALINAFRPSLNASQVDCVASGSCYILMSGTLPVLVFMSVGLYVVLEPQEERIVQIEVSLKRPFRIDAGKVVVEGITPTLLGTAAAGIPDCSVTYGTTWKHVREKCLADNPLAMATVQAVNGYENILVHMGGVLLYFERKGLAIDEILPIAPALDDQDTVVIASINAEYEGDFSMPYSDVLKRYKNNLDARIRAEVPSLNPEDPTGVELLRPPKDHGLPKDVALAYPDRLRPGGISAAFCEDDSDGDGTYDDCYTDPGGRPLLPLVNTLQSLVAETLGDRLTPKLAQLGPYVQEFERALVEHFNGKPLLEEQLLMSPDADAPDRIYATATLFVGKTAHTINVYYGGNDDRMHFLNFQRGTTRMEAVLLRDATLATPEDPDPTGVFTLMHLLGSPRLGLGAVGTVTVDHRIPQTRRALLDVILSEKETAQVLAPFQEASAVSGYWRPVKGPQDEFVPADAFSLFGNTLDAEFWMLPATPGSTEKEIVAIQGNAFFGDVYFCGLPVRIGAYASDLVGRIADAGYPCQFIIRQADNLAFVSELVDLDGQIALGVANDMITHVFAWSR